MSIVQFEPGAAAAYQVAKSAYELAKPYIPYAQNRTRAFWNEVMYGKRKRLRGRTTMTVKRRRTSYATRQAIYRAINANKETKFHLENEADLGAPVAAVANGGALYGPINNPPQGDGFSERVGNSVRGNTLTIRGLVRRNPSASSKCCIIEYLYCLICI